MRISEIASVLWHNPYDASTELCRLLESRDGFALEGIVLVPVGGEPGRVDYRVDTDREWRTRRADLRMGFGSRINELTLVADGSGRWLLDGEHQPHLDGCIDVDLRVTAATNTLPIRRLALSPSEIVHVRAAWVGFPEIQVRPSDQSYERVAETRYRYRSGDFEADLEVDAAGLVLRYGDGFWAAQADRSNASGAALKRLLEGGGEDDSVPGGIIRGGSHSCFLP